VVQSKIWEADDAESISMSACIFVEFWLDRFHHFYQCFDGQSNNVLQGSFACVWTGMGAAGRYTSFLLLRL